MPENYNRKIDVFDRDRLSYWKYIIRISDGVDHGDKVLGGK